MAFRRDLIGMLRSRPMSVGEIARCVEESPGEVEQDLRHLMASLRHTDLRAVVMPARCRKCGFVFGASKLRKPGKCPACKSTWLDEPRLSIEPRPPHPRRHLLR